jgi:asparagine synthase (glutamine-hydrolysing)
MSGIFGMVLLDGGQPRPADIQAMARELERRGPDGTHIWTEGNVAIGHTLLATTPEALVEVLPLTDPDTGCTITADCRLDNREELIGELGLGEIDRVIGDGELILRAYLRWGEDCPVRLLGDFAFAIWDPRQEKLFCARDHMGMRQLIYHHRPEKLFAFATEVDAVLSHSSVLRRINQARIADFLDNMEGFDFTSTFFEQVFRLPPAHCLSVDTQGSHLRRFWRLVPPPELRLPSDEDYAAAFGKIFAQAVRCRLRSNGPVGAMLSGGVDSGSTVAVASKLLSMDGRGPLHTFSGVRANPQECPECEAIRTASSVPGIVPHFVSESDVIEANEQPALLKAIAEPFDGQMTMIRALYSAAKRTAINAVLDGVSGDVVLTSNNVVASLLRQGRFRQAWREAVGASRFWKEKNVWRTLLPAAWVAFVPEQARFLLRQWKWARRDHGDPMARIIAPDFGDRIGLPRRRSRFRRQSGLADVHGAKRRAAIIQLPILVAGRERYDRVAAAFGIEPRDPFLDVRVISFCLSLPEGQLQRDGWPKWILRRAMVGTMPDATIWRRGKEHVGAHFTESLRLSWIGWLNQLRSERQSLESYVIQQPCRPGNLADGRAMELAALAFWLDRNRSAPDIDATP